MIDDPLLALDSRPFTLLFIKCHWSCLHLVSVCYLKKAFLLLYTIASLTLRPFISTQDVNLKMLTWGTVQIFVGKLFWDEVQESLSGLW